MAEKKQTAKERYTQYFWEELEANPGVPPSRKVISERMGWKSPNHSGEMPKIRTALLDQAGFVIFRGRYRHKDLVRTVSKLWNVSHGGQVLKKCGVLRRPNFGVVTRIAILENRGEITIEYSYKSADNMDATYLRTYKEPEEFDFEVLPRFPDRSDSTDVERFLGDDQ